MLRVIVLTAALLFTVGLCSSVAWAQSAPCGFVLGFATLHDLIPTIVGGCLDDESHNPQNGDALQHTSGGLLVWRKADNWTAFTDGYRTWINGPNGLAERLNTQRFSWEANPDNLTLADVVSAHVPVGQCAVSFAVGPANIGPMPATLPVSSGDATGLTFYSDGYLALLAPSGWSCSALVGADGGQIIVITAIPSNALLSSTPPSSDAITAHDASACQGCATELACGLFPGAMSDLISSGLTKCPSTPSPQEHWTRLSATVVAFEDGPYIHGTGYPSGGADPANGVVLYGPSYGPPDRPLFSARTETCTLPEDQHARCTTILNDFVHRYPVTPP